MKLWMVIASAFWVGCLLPDPDYQNTEFQCVDPPFACPDGYDCISGQCVPAEGGGADAGAPADAGDNPADDPQDVPPDAAPPAPDAEPRPTQTATFGERPGSDFTGVTTDSTIKDNDPNDNFGADDLVGFDADPVHHGLLRFELTALPVTSEVTAAELVIFLNNPNESGDVVIFQLREDWDENEVDYLDRRDGQRWTVAGAGPTQSADPTPMASFPGRDIGEYTVPIPPQVVGEWVANPSRNFGVVWRTTSPDGRGGNFDSSETGQPAKAPLLRVTYR